MRLIFIGIGGGICDAMFCARVLTGSIAIVIAASAMTIFDAVQRDDRDALLGVLQGEGRIAALL